MRKAKPENLTQLPPKKKSAILAKLGTVISASRGLALLGADDATLQEIDAVWPQSFSYDAVALLGFGKASREPLPMPAPGEMVIRYGGWSLKDLRDNPLIRKKDLMWVQDWYDAYDWAKEGAEPGIYRLRLPIPDSNDKTSDEQDALLLPDEVRTPICLDATALLVHRLQGESDPLKGGFVRSLSPTSVGLAAVLHWIVGRLNVAYSFWPDRRYSGVRASGARKTS